MIHGDQVGRMGRFDADVGEQNVVNPCGRPAARRKFRAGWWLEVIRPRASDDEV